MHPLDPYSRNHSSRDVFPNDKNVSDNPISSERERQLGGQLASVDPRVGSLSAAALWEIGQYLLPYITGALMTAGGYGVAKGARALRRHWHNPYRNRKTMLVSGNYLEMDPFLGDRVEFGNRGDQEIKTSEDPAFLDFWKDVICPAADKKERNFGIGLDFGDHQKNVMPLLRRLLDPRINANVACPKTLPHVGIFAVPSNERGEGIKNDAIRLLHFTEPELMLILALANSYEGENAKKPEDREEDVVADAQKFGYADLSYSDQLFIYAVKERKNEMVFAERARADWRRVEAALRTARMVENYFLDHPAYDEQTAPFIWTKKPLTPEARDVHARIRLQATLRELSNNGTFSPEECREHGALPTGVVLGRKATETADAYGVRRALVLRDHPEYEDLVPALPEGTTLPESKGNSALGIAVTRTEMRLRSVAGPDGKKKTQVLMERSHLGSEPVWRLSGVFAGPEEKFTESIAQDRSIQSVQRDTNTEDAGKYVEEYKTALIRSSQKEVSDRFYLGTLDSWQDYRVQEGARDILDDVRVTRTEENSPLHKLSSDVEYMDANTQEPVTYHWMDLDDVLAPSCLMNMPPHHAAYLTQLALQIANEQDRNSLQSFTAAAKDEQEAMVLTATKFKRWLQTGNR